jgi:hypothetical protein
MYIKPSTALLNKGSTLKATTLAAFDVFFNQYRQGNTPGSSSSIILSNLSNQLVKKDKIFIGIFKHFISLGWMYCAYKDHK